jgi:signal transduction histidine kinase
MPALQRSITALFASLGPTVTVHAVTSPRFLQAGLMQTAWDAIIYVADDAIMPLSELDALRAESNPHLPLIMLCKQPSPVYLQAALEHGAHGVVEEKQLEHLVLAVRRVLEETRCRNDHRHTLAKLEENEARFRRLTSHLPGMLFHLQQTSPLGEYQFLYASEGSQKLFGATSRELLASAARLFEAFELEERKSLHRALHESAHSGALLNWEGRTRGRTRHKWINLRSMPHRLSNGLVEWHGIASNVTDSKESEVQLRQSREQLAELSAHLEAVKEEERERISRDIHDELGSILVRIKIEVALLSSRLPETNDRLGDKAHSIEALLNQAISTASRVSRELRPGILKEFGLTAAIECQAEDFTQRFNIPCHVQADQDIPEPAAATSLALFRVAQEAMTNIAKHAHASQVFIRLYAEHGNIVLEVRDNGRGISEADMQKPKSFGLRGIRERIASLSGSFRIEPAEQGGTQITLSIPEYPRTELVETEIVQRTLF